MRNNINKELVHQNLVKIKDSLDFDLRDHYINGRSDLYMRLPGYDYDIIFKAYLNTNALSVCIRPKSNYKDLDINEIKDEFELAGFCCECARKTNRIIKYLECDIENEPSQSTIDWVNNCLNTTINILNAHYE